MLVDNEKLRILRDVDIERTAGKKIDEACEAHGISNPTYYKWRNTLIAKGLYGDAATNPPQTVEPPVADPDDTEEADDADGEVIYVDDALTALCQSDDELIDRLSEIIEAWIPRVTQLMESGTTAGVNAGVLLDNLLLDFKNAIETESEEETV